MGESPPRPDGRALRERQAVTVGFRPPYGWITRGPGAGRGSDGSGVGWVQPTVAVRAFVVRITYGRAGD